MSLIQKIKKSKYHLIISVLPIVLFAGIVKITFHYLILVCIFTFVIFAILKLIKDMEDPFEYDGSYEAKSDEISLEVLDNLQKEFERKYS